MSISDKEGLAVVKSLMAVQENSFRSMIEVMFNGLREDIKEVKKDAIELQKSLEFSQRDVMEIEQKLSLVTETVNKNCTSFEEQTIEFMRVENKVEYNENQSRRNNIKLIGLNESDEEVSWDDTEKIVLDCVKNKLNLQVEVEIERAHRIGIKRPPGATREDSSSYGPRPVVAKLRSWKQKEAILKTARFKRHEGKNAYFIRDKLVIREKPFRVDRRPRRRLRQVNHEHEDDDDTEVSVG